MAWAGELRRGVELRCEEGRVEELLHSHFLSINIYVDVYKLAPVVLEESFMAAMTMVRGAR